MSRSRERLAVFGGCLVLLVGCGNSADEGRSNTTSASASPSTTATLLPFDVAAWKLQWGAARQDFADALGRLSSEVRFLLDKGASDAQVATVFPRLATEVANAAGAFVVALDAAGPIPADRSDVASAAAVLREAIVGQQQAYAAVATCGEDAACQQGALGAVPQGTVGAAVNGLPDE